MDGDVKKTEVVKVGECVECIDSENSAGYLKSGAVYKVTSILGETYTLTDGDGRYISGWRQSRFIPAVRTIPPEEWQAGDIVRCNVTNLGYLVDGKEFTIKRISRSKEGSVYVYLVGNEIDGWASGKFDFIRRHENKSNSVPPSEWRSGDVLRVVHGADGFSDVGEEVVIDHLQVEPGLRYVHLVKSPNDAWDYDRLEFVRRPEPPIVSDEKSDESIPYAGPRFEPGDIVRCIQANKFSIINHQYTVQLWISNPEGRDVITLREIAGTFDPADFEFISRPQKRDVPARGFWMVKGNGSASYEHCSVESAESEAKRLALEHHGITFTVLGPISSFAASDLQKHDLTTFLEAGECTSGLPF